MTVTSERGAGEGAASEPPKRNRSEGRGDWSSWPNYEAAATQDFRGSWWYPVMWSSQLRQEARRRRAARDQDRADPRQRRRVRAARPVPAPRRAALARQAGVPRHDQLPVPRLDLRPRQTASCAPSSPTAPTRRSAARSAVETYPVGRAARHGLGLRRRQPGRRAAGRRRASPRSCASTRSAWAAASTSAAAAGASRPRTASTRATPSTCTARRCGACSR